MVANGVYEVQEAGLVFKHNIAQQAEPKPTTPQGFLDEFSQNFEMRILERPSQDHLVLELNHVDVSFVNALRRILLAEVPTVAIEMVYMLDNTSIIHDEVLAHRMGLIPIYFDSRRLQDWGGGDDNNNNNSNGGSEEEEGNTIEPTDRNTIVFRLAVGCDADDVREHRRQQQERVHKSAQQQQQQKTRGGAAADDDEDEDSENEGVVDKKINPLLEEATVTAARTSIKHQQQRQRKNKEGNNNNNNNNKSGLSSDIPVRPYTKHVYSGDMQWVPQGDQLERFGKDADIRPVHDDILIAKLRPGQAIELEAHARKGIGKDHAKYSPVATASYRLYTEIELLEPVYDELAEELVHIYEPGVFELVPTTTTAQGGTDPPHTKFKARVCNPYACTMSRNYMRNPKLTKAIKMTRIPDRFIFSIESVGMHSPAVLLGQALKVLQGKCQRLQDLADQTIEETTTGGGGRGRGGGRGGRGGRGRGRGGHRG